jgi:hypothetical protein
LRKYENQYFDAVPKLSCNDERTFVFHPIRVLNIISATQHLFSANELSHTHPTPLTP